MRTMVGTETLRATNERRRIKVSTKDGDSYEWPCEFRVISVADCFIDETYQRPSNPDFINSIVEHFDPRKVKAVSGSVRSENQIALWNGQQRWLAVKLLGIETIPALLLHGLSIAEEAKLFADTNFDTKLVKSWYHYRALRVARDGGILDIERIVTKRGFRVGYSVQPEDMFGCCATLIAIHSGQPDRVRGEGKVERGPGILAATLDAITHAWRDRVSADSWTQAKTAAMVGGISYWLSSNPDVDSEMLREVLVSSDPQVLVEEAHRIARGTGSGKGRGIPQAIDRRWKKRS